MVWAYSNHNIVFKLYNFVMYKVWKVSITLNTICSYAKCIKIWLVFFLAKSNIESFNLGISHNVVSHVRPWLYYSCVNEDHDYFGNLRLLKWSQKVHPSLEAYITFTLIPLHEIVGCQNLHTHTSYTYK